MAAPGVTVVQRFLYRGALEEFSNTYHIVGDAPSDSAGWEALNDDLTALIAPFLTVEVQIIRAYCYENTDDHSVFTDDLLARTSAPFGAIGLTTGRYYAPGDAAAWIRWKTARTNTHGKPIYLRKYYHSIVLEPEGSVDYDLVSTTQKTALEDGGVALNAVSGAWPGIAGPDGVAPGLSSASQYVTTRTLKRRGIRPH